MFFSRYSPHNKTKTDSAAAREASVSVRARSLAGSCWLESMLVHELRDADGLRRVTVPRVRPASAALRWRRQEVAPARAPPDRRAAAHVLPPARDARRRRRGARAAAFPE